jgi:tetratricopeptide (TPR) repeat protein
LDKHDQDLARLKEIRQAEEAKHRDLQLAVQQLEKLTDDARFREIMGGTDDRTGTLSHFGTANRTDTLRTFKAPLEALGLSPENAAESAIEFDRRYFQSEIERQAVAAKCFQVLIDWAEAAAAPDSDPAKLQVGARQALRLMTTAETLAASYQLPIPQVFHIRKANYLEAAGDFEASPAERARAATETPTPLDHFLAAQDRFQGGEYFLANAECDELLRREPNNYWAHYLQALCSIKRQSWDEARLGFTLCLGLRPELGFWPLQFRAVARSGLLDYSAAEADFKAALGLAANDLEKATARINRGSMYLRQGRPEEALVDLHEAIRLRSDIYQAYVDVAAALEIHAELSRISASLMKHTYEDLAGAYSASADLDAAAEALGQAMVLRRNDAKLCLTRAQLHVMRSDVESAKQDYRQVIDLEARGKQSKDRLTAQLALARLEHQAGNFDQALAWCNLAVQECPDDPDAHLQRARCLLALPLPQYKELGEEFDRFMKTQERQTAWAFNARGLIHAHLRQYPEAVDAFSKALTLKPDADTRCSRGWVYLRLEYPKLALADFETALSVKPSSAEALSGRGRTRVLLGEIKPGIADAEQAVQLEPYSPRYLFNAACVYASAASQMESRRQPSGANVVYYQDRAARLLRDALDQVPEKGRAAFWNDHIRNEPALSKLRRWPIMQRLAKTYEPLADQ